MVAAASRSHRADACQRVAGQGDSNGGDLAKAAKATGLDVKTSDDFGRDETVEGLGSASYLQEAFACPDNTDLWADCRCRTERLSARSLKHVQPDSAKLAEQRNAIRDELKTQKARDRAALFEEGLKQDLIKQGKMKIHQDVVIAGSCQTTGPS